MTIEKDHKSHSSNFLDQFTIQSKITNVYLFLNVLLFNIIILYRRSYS